MFHNTEVANTLKINQSIQHPPPLKKFSPAAAPLSHGYQFNLQRMFQNAEVATRTKIKDNQNTSFAWKGYPLQRLNLHGITNSS